MQRHSYKQRLRGYKNRVTNQPICETSDTIPFKEKSIRKPSTTIQKELNYRNIHPPHEVTETSHSFGWGTAALRISSLMLNPSGREYGLMRLVAPHFFASSWVLRFPNFHGIYDQKVKIELICCFQQFCTSLLAQAFLAELQDVSRSKIYKYIYLKQKTTPTIPARNHSINKTIKTAECSHCHSH